jgi:Mce-associated membrane protein
VTELPEAAMRGRHRAAHRPPRRPGAIGRRLVAVLTILCLAATATLGVLLLRRHDRKAIETARTQAVGAARTAAGDILGYDYRSVEESIRRARADTTGTFRKQYDTTAKTLLPQAKQLKAIVQATVGSAAVMNATTSRVVVLLFVDQATVKQVPGEKTPTTRIDQSRVRMTMTHVDGRWLVSELTAL